MVQESIVEYINAQMKLGVPRDAIKTTLVGAGWAAADVEDTLKKVESAKMASTGPAMGAVSGMAASKPSMPAGMATTPASQTIKVSDLVSAGPAVSVPVTKSAMPAKAADTFQASSFAATKPHRSRGTLIMGIVLIVIILAVGGFAGFLFMQNNTLNSQLSALNGQSSGVNSQLSALQAQVAASTTALTAQVSTLATANQELQTELSFFVASTSTAPGTTSTATVGGTVAGGKTSYIITTTDGAKIFVANSKIAPVIAALTPLMASTPAAATSTASSTAAGASSTAPVAATPATVAQFTGTYVPGSDMITLTAVNGTAL
jgi:hypothetical protein